MITNEKREKMARVIMEATVQGDEAACEKNGINLRTLQRWRALLRSGDDAALSSCVADKKSKLEANWADEIPDALRAAVRFLKKAATQADPKDPQAIHSVAGAMKLLSEVSVTWKVLDARLARQAGQARAPDSPIPAGAGTGGKGGGDGRTGEGAGTVAH